jgi:hypothetical protein
MSITAYARDTIDGEIKGLEFVSSFAITLRQPSWLEERNNERAKTAVDMETNLVFLGEDG